MLFSEITQKNEVFLKSSTYAVEFNKSVSTNMIRIIKNYIIVSQILIGLQKRYTEKHFLKLVKSNPKFELADPFD